MLAHASPSVRKFSRELGVDLSKLKGSGRKGRITKEDVQKFVKQSLEKSVHTDNYEFNVKSNTTRLGV